MTRQSNSKPRSHRHKQRGPIEETFICRNCHMYVSCAPWIAGVQNRNHCPYCLWSRHLDLYVGGDRRSACHANMQPIGLTTKHKRNKYAQEDNGELMLIHCCSVCAKIALNRIAADDNPVLLCQLLDHTTPQHKASTEQLATLGIRLLTQQDIALVQRRLFGTQYEPNFTN